MLHALPYSFLFSARVKPRRLTMAALQGGFDTAVGLLAHARQGERTVWRAHGLSLMLGGVIPLLGTLLFDWPIFVVTLAVLLDCFGMWLADVLKAMRAPWRFKAQARYLRDAEDTLSIARSMHERRRDGTTGLEFDARVDGPDPLQNTLALFLVLGMLLLISFSVVFWDVERPSNDPFYLYTVGLLAVSVIVRVALALWDARPQVDDEHRMHLLPQFLVPFGVLVFAFLAYMKIDTWRQDNSGIPADLPPLGGIWFLAIYLLFSVTAGAIGLRRAHGAEAELGRFVAAGLPELKERLRAVNGDD